MSAAIWTHTYQITEHVISVTHHITSVTSWQTSQFDKTAELMVAAHQLLSGPEGIPPSSFWPLSILLFFSTQSNFHFLCEDFSESCFTCQGLLPLLGSPWHGMHETQKVVSSYFLILISGFSSVSAFPAITIWTESSHSAKLRLTIKGSWTRHFKICFFDMRITLSWLFLKNSRHRKRSENWEVILL